MTHLYTQFKLGLDRTVQSLYTILMEEQSPGFVTRFAITFLDLWQAIIILNHNYWIPQLVDVTIPVQIYMIYTSVLAGIAILALALSNILWISAIALGLNVLTYLVLGVASLWYYDPPRASAGFAFFVMFTAVAAFWRVTIRMVRDRVIAERS